jgi:hypothetical protein
VVNFIIGLLVGGLVLSSLWGLFWLSISIVGVRRGTCHWRIALNSLAAGMVPLLCIGGLMWWAGGAGTVGMPFGMGLLGMPTVLMGFGLRRAQDGQRAGAHMMSGVRHLRDQLLGHHAGCGGCAHEHDQEGCA